MITLVLLGGLNIEGPAIGDGSPLRRRRALALLALLASAHPQTVSRERVLDLLWPESDGARAGNSLRQLLHSMRRDQGGEEELVLREGATGLRLNPNVLGVDLWAFREALKRGSPGEAVQLYSGPFLHGFLVSGLPEFAQWADEERDRIARSYLEALDTLASRAQDAGALAEAVAWRRRRAAAEPFSTTAALKLLEALADAGDTGGALRYAGMHEALVRAELDLEPDSAIQAFVAHLREMRDGGAARAPVGRTPGSEPHLAEPIGNEPEMGTPNPTNEAALVMRPRSRWRLPTYLLGCAALLALLIIVGALGTGDAASTVGPVAYVGVASGSVQESGRDPATLLVECTGPACPDGPLPQPAPVVPQHPYYRTAPVGTAYLATTEDGTTLPESGFECCTEAVFEHEFSLPARAFSAHIVLSVLADNQASAEVNGQVLGGHPEPLAAENYAGPPLVLSGTFVADPSGRNTIRIRLWNGGGALAVHFHGFVTYELPEESDEWILPPLPDGKPGDESPHITFF